MKRSIFYLDDEASCLKVFQITFGNDYDVRTATTLAESRLFLAERPFDIVISDQCMPDIEGTEFLRLIARDYPESCRVLLTGGVQVGECFRQISSGIIQFFIVKPWTEQSVRQVLDRTKLAFDLRGAKHRFP